MIFFRKNAPRKIYFLTDFIKTYLCALLDGGIGKCNQSQTWRYQGATVLHFTMAGTEARRRMEKKSKLSTTTKTVAHKIARGRKFQLYTFASTQSCYDSVLILDLNRKHLLYFAGHNASLEIANTLLIKAPNKVQPIAPRELKGTQI